MIAVYCFVLSLVWVLVANKWFRIKKYPFHMLAYVLILWAVIFACVHGIQVSASWRDIGPYVVGGGLAAFVLMGMAPVPFEAGKPLDALGVFLLFLVVCEVVACLLYSFIH